jgi:hypothetical protein
MAHRAGRSSCQVDEVANMSSPWCIGKGPFSLLLLLSASQLDLVSPGQSFTSRKR